MPITKEEQIQRDLTTLRPLIGYKDGLSFNGNLDGEVNLLAIKAFQTKFGGADGKGVKNPTGKLSEEETKRLHDMAESRSAVMKVASQIVMQVDGADGGSKNTYMSMGELTKVLKEKNPNMKDEDLKKGVLTLMRSLDSSGKAASDDYLQKQGSIDFLEVVNGMQRMGITSGGQNVDAGEVLSQMMNKALNEQKHTVAKR